MGPKCHHKCPPYKRETGDFPRGPVAGLLCFHCKGHRFDPWSGKIPHTAWCGQKKKKEKEKETERDFTHTEEKTEAEARVMQSQVRDSWSHQKPEELRDKFSSRALPACAALLTP